jgi:hypothetical protein
MARQRGCEGRAPRNAAHAEVAGLKHQHPDALKCELVRRHCSGKPAAADDEVEAFALLNRAQALGAVRKRCEGPRVNIGRLERAGIERKDRVTHRFQRANEPCQEWLLATIRPAAP